jgi:acyl transferase domain-containing protein/NADPH:quinone reductase-like Zn-dependent oxidoreductase
MKEEVDIRSSKRLFVLSAHDKLSTEKAMQNLSIYLEQRPEVFQNDLLANLAYTLGQRRALHPWRIAVTASSGEELVEVLSSGKVIPTRQELNDLSIGWIFTGQGAQWWAMGRELFHQYSVYASALERADTHLRSLGADFSLLEELQKDEDITRVNAALISQPACTAVQLALVNLLRSWGVVPSAVVGHSSGEIGAAYAAGLITFDDAMTIAYHRGRLIPILKKKYPELNGSMMAVGAGKSEIAPLLDLIPPSQGEARIACINSPSSVTVSGDGDAIAELQILIEERYPGTFARKLQVDTAYHSHHMNLMAKDYTKSLINLQTPKSSAVRFHSSLLGRLADGRELDATYWVRNLTCAVRFDEALQSMCSPADDGIPNINHLIELGPHAALQGPVKQILKHIGGPSRKIAYSSALSRKQDATESCLGLAQTLFLKGAKLDCGAINFPKALDRPPQVLTDLPRYAWNHSSSFYHESRLTKIHKFHDTPRNDIIGILAPYANDFEPTWRNVVRLDDLPWLRHHQIQGVCIFPISGFVAMAFEAIAQRARQRSIVYDSLEVKGLEVKAPAMLTEEELEMTITLRSCPEGTGNLSREFVICSWSKSRGWTEHCTGSISANVIDNNEVDGNRVRAWKKQKLKTKLSATDQTATHPFSSETLYSRLSELGVSYGVTFQGLQGSRISKAAATARITPVDTAIEMPHQEESNYIIHPTLLEQLISMYWLNFNAAGALDTVHLPSSIGTVRVSAKLGEHLQSPDHTLEAFCEPHAPLSAMRSNTLAMFATNADGEAIIEVEDLVVMPIVEDGANAENIAARELCYKLGWETVSSTSNGTTNGTSTPRFDAEIVIIHGESRQQCDMATTLSNHFAELTGRLPSMGCLSALVPCSKDKLCIFITELERPLLVNLDEAGFASLQQLLTTVQGVLWVVKSAYANSTNPDLNMITGLSRTLRSEGTLMKFATLDLDLMSSDTSRAASTVTDVFARVFATGSNTEELEFLERDGRLYTPKIINDDHANAYVHETVSPSSTALALFSDLKRPLKATLNRPGVVDSVSFEDDDRLQNVLPADHVELQVKAIGVNSVDCGSESALGLECSGIVTAVGTSVPNIKVGDRVAAITNEGASSTIVRVHSALLFKLPAYITFELAATLPLSFCTVAYGLLEQAGLSEGGTVLVHDAGSTLGQVALSTARMFDAQLWTTVKTTEEKKLLMREFSIPQERIWYANSEAFAEVIKDVTGGRGIDVILHTATEPRMLEASFSCLASFGRLVNIGSGHAISRCIPFEKNVSVFSIEVTSLLTYRPQIVQRTLTHMARLLQYGTIQAFSTAPTFGISDVAGALQSTQAATGKTKAVIVPRDDELVMVSIPSQLFRIILLILH